MELFTDACGQDQRELSCLDRVVISGTIPVSAMPMGMSSYLRIKGIPIFNYPRWAEPLRDQIRQRCHGVGRYNAGLPSSICATAVVRKARTGARGSQKRGEQEGLVVHLLGDGSLPQLQALAR